MAETIMGASGQNLMHVTTGGAALITGSVSLDNAQINVDVTVGDYVSIVGSPAYNLPTIGSVEISTIRTMPTTTVTATNLDIRDLAPTQDYVSIVGSPAYSIPVIGSVEVSNNINVQITTDDYISIVGSPNYSLPAIGSVEISTIRTMPTTTVTATNLDIRDLTSASDSVAVVGSVQVSSVVANVGVTQQTTPWTTEGSAIQKGTWNVGLSAGTNLIGSVIASPVGIQTIIGSVEFSNTSLDINTTTSDYISIVGSPNYNLPAIGSVEISTIRTMPTTTVTATNLDIRDLTSASDSVTAVGSVQVSSIVGALPTGTNVIGYIGSIGAGIIGSVAVTFPGDQFLGSVKVTTISGGLPTGTNMIGSVLARISDSPPAWTGIGSIVPFDASRDGSAITFDWVGAVTGSVMAIPATGSRFNITDVFCSASGQGIVTLFFNADNTSNRISKGNLANLGGFASNYSKPLPGPINGSLMITTAATGFTPVGTATINVFQSA